METMNNSFWKEIGRPKSLRQQVADQIINALSQGLLEPGKRIVEVELAQNLGISRAPIREALSQLEQEGLVKTIPYRGTFVMDLNRKDVWELYTLRATLEEFAMRQVFERNLDETINSLREIHKAMGETVHSKNKLELAELDSRFHEVLVRAAGHEQLYRSWHPLRYKHVFYTITIDPNYSKSFEFVVDVHEELIRAMESGELEKACEEIKSHIIDAGKSLLSRIQDTEGDEKA
ncbi:GntR family transcriptional regulator [Halalkalibacter alkaliphilus]|uniref:GntR family transcriptional regulator n=1 Tax=Halalkalibacter alkaliphilus TaxID=2917993 RepID=A0A9X2I6Z3_9BACI|nr:GntR family transcriptional regulator [Halalkalibacter alkaliphilus]MCL7749511.1 GntR family transcriptional regulator [Halalkalibacter alkaliphilus]